MNHDVRLRDQKIAEGSDKNIGGNKIRTSWSSTGSTRQFYRSLRLGNLW